MDFLVDVRQRVVRIRPEIVVAVGVSVLLLSYGNAVSGLSHDVRGRFLLWSNLALMVALLVWAFRYARLSRAELGLDVRKARASVIFGLGLTLLAAIPPLLFIVLAPLFNGGPVESDETTERSGGALAVFVLFRQPVGTALFEEVAFRGVLYGTWLRAGGERAAILATASVFALWHSVITSRTVIESGVVETPLTTAAAVVISLAGLFVGGLLFGYFRWRTRSIAAPFVSHWLIVALLTVAVWIVS